MKPLSISTLRRRLAAARADLAKINAFIDTLPTEGFNADKALTPAMQRRGVAQRAVWNAEEKLNAAKLAARARN